MGRRVKVRPNRGSHLPALLRVLRLTSGPVLEMGAGIYSTPILHWLCEMDGRRLVTYENSDEFYEWAVWFQRGEHTVHLVDNWDDVDLSPAWSVAFVDHAPDERRRFDIARLTHAEYVVAHDSDDGWRGKYKYDRVSGLFKHVRRYEALRPNTTVFSNTHPLEDLW